MAEPDPAANRVGAGRREPGARRSLAGGGLALLAFLDLYSLIRPCWSLAGQRPASHAPGDNQVGKNAQFPVNAGSGCLIAGSHMSVPRPTRTVSSLKLRVHR